MTRRWFPTLRNVLALLLLATSPLLRAESQEPLTASFLTSELRLNHLGTAAIALETMEASPGWKVLALESEQPEIVRIVRAPELGPDRTLAFARIEALAEGQAILRSGQAVLNVYVRADEAPRSERPRIVSPSEGAFAWGKISVGVEMPARAYQSTGNTPLMRLVLGDGTQLEPTALTQQGEEPILRYHFEVDCDNLPMGQQRWQAAMAEEGHWLSAFSAPRTVHVIKPAKSALLRLESEAIENPAERPRRYGQRQPPRTKSKGAHGKGAVRMNSSNPSLAIPVSVKEPGLYQLVARARGESGGGALPSLALYADDSDRPATAARTVSNQWHRLPIGGPFALEAGEQILGLRFGNDFYVPGKADRNVEVDQVELLRLDAAAPPKQASMMMGATESEAADRSMLAMMSMAERENLPARLQLAWHRPCEGQLASGTFTVRALTTREPHTVDNTPHVQLLINGEVVASQIAARPIFEIDGQLLQAGENKLELVAEIPGEEAVHATPQRVRSLLPGQPAQALKHYRFSVEDPAWDEKTRSGLQHQEHSQGKYFRKLSSNGSARLSLPASLSGRHAIDFIGRGENFKGQAEIRLTLHHAGGKEVLLDTHKVHGWHHDQRLGPFELPTGEKEIEIAFINDHYEEGVGDRNLVLDGLAFHELAITEDKQEPEIALLYPKADQSVWGADLVVAEAQDNRRLKFVDLLIDGKRQHLNVRPKEGLGRVILPIRKGDAKPGTYEVRLWAEDTSGNRILSEGRRLTLLAEQPAEPLPYERAVMLADAFAYGPEAKVLADILTYGEESWIRTSLARSWEHPAEQAALGNATTLLPNEEDRYHVKNRVLQHLLKTDNPARARFVNFAENHFSTWIGKVGNSTKWREHLAFSERGVAPFRDLLWCSATSPAMLYYLDQQNSFVDRLNENYAREILELHTYGVDNGYSQADVTTLASILNGWMVSDEADPLGNTREPMRDFRFDPVLSDGSPAELLGLRFAETAVGDRFERIIFLLEVLAASPQTATYLSQKLLAHYGHPQPSDEAIEAMTQRFLQHGGDLQAILLDLWQDDSYRAALRGRSRLATPLDFALKLARCSGNDNHWRIHQLTGSSGYGVYESVTPDGYPEEDEAYANSNAMIQRWRYSAGIRGSLGSLVDGINHRDDAAMVEMAAIRLSGFPLSERSQQAALNFLAESPSTGWERKQEASAFVAMLPEIQKRHLTLAEQTR